MKFKAVIFDLDGTLVDTLDDLYITMNTVLKKGGYPSLDKATVRHLIGNGAREFMRLSLPPHARSEQNVDKNLLAYYEEYQNYSGRAQKFDGIDKLLTSLKNAGYKLAVLSNKPHQATLNVIDKFFPDFKFDEVMGQTEHFEPKPDTGSALYLLKQLNTSPHQTVFVGDGDADALTSIGAGMYHAAALWGYRTREELKAVGARNFFEDVNQLYGLLLPTKA